jgi:predicted GNAT superfamily acetyltransferase
MTDFRFRDLASLDEFREVVALERQIWGYTDASDIVTVPVFVITVKRGGILVGAVDASDRLAGFTYSLVGMKDGRALQWSHMTGVLPEHQGTGLGYRLKLAQRERALAAGFDLIEWTFDPLQALNAHFNFAKLGTVAEEYADDVYGESSSGLHRGTPTDRLVAQWWIREPRVERRLAPAGGVRPAPRDSLEAPVANHTIAHGRWRRNREIDLTIDGRRLLVEIPIGFTDMLREVPDLALEWRFQTREIFHAYLRRGYRVVDFLLDREQGYGRYLLTQDAWTSPLEP